MTTFDRSRTTRSAWRMVRVTLAVAGLAGALIGPAVVSAAKPQPPCTVSAGVTFSVHNTVITGTSGDDVIDCSNARKGYTISGMGGNDLIWGGKARDVIWGHSLDATRTCDGSVAYPGGDQLFGGGGNDEIHGGVWGGGAEGGPGNDLIIAEGGPVFFDGGAGDDTIDMTKACNLPDVAGEGSSASGGLGNDHIIGATDVCVGENGDEGNDVLDGGDGVCVDALTGYIFGDGLEGGEGDDSLNGNGGPDHLLGGLGIDQLDGGDGDDFLIDASSDADFFIGGGNDTFPDGSLPFPDGYAGDRCFDQDGEGTAPDYPDGSGTTGSVSPAQNDVISGCEVLYVSP